MLAKKGELELRYIILLILGLIVLIAIIIVFRQQIMHFVDSITSVSTEINQTRPPINDLIGN